LSAENSSDDNNDIQVYSWSTPDGSVLSTDQRFSYSTPTVDKETLIEITLTVTDGKGLSDTDTVSIRVTPEPPLPLIVNAGKDFTVLSGEAITLDAGASQITASDDTIRYSWLSHTQRLISESKTTSFPSPVVTNDTTLTFTLIIYNNEVLVGSDSINVKIRAPKTKNLSPIAVAGDDLTISSGEEIHLPPYNSYDIDYDIWGYAWHLKTGTPLYFINDRFKAPNVQKTTQFEYQLTVFDILGKSDTDNITITVEPLSQKNQLPTAVAGNNISTVSGVVHKISARNSSDHDGEIEGYAWYLEGELYATGEEIEFYTPEVLYPTDLKMTLVVVDNQGGADSDSLTISIQSDSNENNFPIAVVSDPVLHVFASEEIELNGENSTDSDGSIVKYLWQRNSKVLSTNKQYRLVAPSVATRTTFEYTLTVYDDKGGFSSDSTFVTVLPRGSDSTGPTADAGNYFSVKSGETIHLDGSNSFKLDGAITKYEWLNVEKQVLSNEAHYYFEARSVKSPQRQTMILEVTDDDGHKTSDEVTYTIYPQSYENITPVPVVKNRIIANANETIRIDANDSYDRDGRIQRYEWRLGDQLISSQSSLVLTTPTTNTETIYDITLTVFDDLQGSATAHVTLTVIPESNYSPTANAGEDIITHSGELVEITGRTPFDKDGSVTALAWTNGSHLLSTRDDFSFSAPEVDAVTKFDIELSVVDNSGATDHDRVTITILPKAFTNQAPVANPGNDYSVTSGGRLDLIGDSSLDPDGIIAEYLWSLGDTLVQVGPYYVQKAPQVLENTIYDFSLTVIDYTGLINNENITISVQPDTSIIPAPVDKKVENLDAGR